MQPKPRNHFGIRPHPALAQTAYFDERFQRDAIKLLPGEFFYTDADPVIVTVLGSCVSACVRDIRSGIGGMNHFMLPQCESTRSARNESMIYGDKAMDVLIERLMDMGAIFGNLEAKVFGGAHISRSMANTDIGQRNADFAIDYLQRKSIPLQARDLGGELARKVYFFPSTGQALVRRLTHLANDTVQNRDRDYANCIKPKLK